jgi:hypothetical protein
MKRFFSNELHGWNTSVIYTIQNYFQDKGVSIMRQTNLKIIFNDIADESLMANISLKIARGRASFLSDCFEIISKCFPKERRSYILVDSHNESEMNSKRLFIKTHIFPDADNKIRPIYFLK